MKITTVKTVVLLDVLRELQIAEWTALGLPVPDTGTSMKLPDGRDDIHSRIWCLMCNSIFGNQRFNNDSWFRYIFTIEGEPIDDPDELILYNHCKEAITNEDGCEMLLFEVMW